MDFAHFKAHLAQQPSPVILLEGTRAIPPSDKAALTAFAQFLAQQFPQARFRSGNADGSDTLLARGVESVDPSRMELVIPTTGHRRKNRHPQSPVFSLADISPDQEGILASACKTATPRNHGLIVQRHRIPSLGSKARYLLRDALKVAGAPNDGLAPASMAVFYTKPDPMAGGTGHTIRVCRQQGVPVVLQDVWMQWLP